MQKEELVLRRRLIDLAKRAYDKGIVTYSDFLNLNELNILYTTPKELFHSRYKTFGGYELSERQRIGFLPDALFLLDRKDYPIDTVKIMPANKKFAEQLSHRDYLGAILNLGIERSKLGDILLYQEYALLFIDEKLSDFLIESLFKVKRTVVRCEKVSGMDIDYQPSYQVIKGSIASVRLDTLLALAYASSRSKIVGLIEGGKVFVNGRLIISNGYQVKEGDIISVRGLGRFVYVGIQSQTKKGRLYVTLNKYI